MLYAYLLIQNLENSVFGRYLINMNLQVSNIFSSSLKTVANSIRPNFRIIGHSNYCFDVVLVISGLVVYHFPIEDGMIPTSVSALNRLLVKIRKRIADGNRVLIHCYGKYQGYILKTTILHNY